MIKAIGLIMITASCSAIGFSVKRNLSRRSLSLKSIVSALEIIKSEISFREKEICDILPLINEYGTGVSVTFFDCILCKMNEKKLSFFESAKEASFILSKNGLKKQDVDEVLTSLSVVGKYDSGMQTERLERSIARLCELEKNAAGEAEKNGRLYGALGVTVGILLAVILI